jgi:DNA polymerase I-like protein with 3'-5' exonuclease and polymerase domains
MRPLPPLPEWLILENQVAQILTQQETHGWYFDEKAARELESTLRKEYEETTKLLRDRYPFVAGPIFTPKRNNRTQGYIEGTGRTEKHEHCGEIIEIEECSLTKLKELNPTSRDHIAWILRIHCGWMPSSMTSTGKPVIDEIVLKDIGTDIALQFLTLLDLTKKLGMISEGVNAWQKLVTTSSRIHHHCSVATSTFRCAHRKPNLAQVPSDERFRRLFTASPGYCMVGADLSGIELRMLAHYLARYDRGRYTEILLTGDIHAENAKRIGITRKQVKTVTYAFLYGAGDRKIGKSIDKQLDDEKATKRGKEVRAAYIAAIPGLKELLEAVREAVKERPEPYLLGLDNRRILVDSGHKSLNYLLQGSSAILAKRWMVLANEHLPKTARQVAFVHDELQFECKEKDKEDLKFLLELTAIQAGEYYKMRCPVAAESKSGTTWADVH